MYIRLSLWLAWGGEDPRRPGNNISGVYKKGVPSQVKTFVISGHFGCRRTRWSLPHLHKFASRDEMSCCPPPPRKMGKKRDYANLYLPPFKNGWFVSSGWLYGGRQDEIQLWGLHFSWWGNVIETVPGSYCSRGGKIFFWMDAGPPLSISTPFGFFWEA